MNAKDLVQKARERGGYPSLASLAKAVDVNHSSLSLLASGKSELSDETYIKLAKLAGVDPTEVIIEKHMRKAGPEGQKVWANLAKALPKSAALLLVILLITPYNQIHVALSKFSMVSNTYYVK
ncbi:helix-turn-helix transcriptional regulator [Acidithiobacillus ferrooxidans F221]|uniref:helix-turn-helix domain-containing protein n=1 Tax=Acidithiobacillus ferrooxidans TaxID=920 RepID=UPI001C078BF4|nr:helix-turn-helix transcriptional regulator [Acidithiobacillus ferrooxidans]MBU2807566.1 helix-turn-helix transcriptional regulator [Acidithiobacillus ferrooxidans F221]